MNQKEKLLGILGDASSLLLVKGQVRNIQKAANEDGQIYYIADVRYVRQSSDDVYGTNWNVTNVCFSAAYVEENKVNDEVMKAYKDNECVLILSLASKLDIQKKDDRTLKFNRCSFYVDSIDLVREITKPISATAKFISI